MKSIARSLVVFLLLFVTMTVGSAQLALASPSASGGDVIITGVFDGSLSGGLPKGMELVVLVDGTDLSQFGVGSANNGGGSDGLEFTMSGTADRGDFIYIASEAPQFTAFFGFAPTFTDSAMLINGDDAVELFFNGAVVDTFGDIDLDGTGQNWDYLDGWAYRNDNTETEATRIAWDESTFTYSGTNELEGGTNNATADTPFPFGTYQSTPTAVELSSFTATATANGDVNVEWTTAAEWDHAGFNVYRSDSENGALVSVNAQIVAATGLQGQGASYSLMDAQATAATTVWYTLEDIDIFGNRTSHGPISVDISAPTAVGFASADSGLASSSNVLQLATILVLLGAMTSVMIIGKQKREEK